jgi:hypothetical protein
MFDDVLLDALPFDDVHATTLSAQPAIDIAHTPTPRCIRRV